ncbi:MAG: xanthine dehydrogenase family protein subunit M [Alphaproteobacteria bacterium]|nr:xanthine dehydrogenase family protein subunit M [Alphaproteobacteria bacterium]
MHDFNYQKVSNVADAVSALKAADDGKVMAGGMTLLPTMKQRLAAPSDVIDLGGISGIDGVSVSGGITVGAMATHASVAGSSTVKGILSALADLAEGIGDPQVRNRGTIGGSVANNDPAADYPAACLALGATIKTDRREISADDFFQGLFETALEEDEIITSVSFPAAEKSAYVKFPNPASRYALVGVFVAKKANGVRVAVTGAGDEGVFRATALEKALSSDFSASALDGASVSADGLMSDIHASAEYRAHLITIMAKRAVAAAG